ARTHRTFGPDSASVAMDNSLNGRQSYTGAFERLGLVKALKHPKQLIRVLHIKPDSVVSDEHDRLIVFSIDTSHLDLRVRPCARELDGIQQEIHQCDREHRTVGIYIGKCSKCPRNIAPYRLRRCFTYGVRHELFEAEERLSRFGTPDS